jgi:aspartyl-tRNA(Asn)/glutamyl-tRNA(Gln) amidotransferase subunit A
VSGAGDLAALGAVEVASGVASGAFRAEEVVLACLDRARAADAELHIWNELQADRALERARSIDRARASGAPLPALAGVPVALKDNLCTSWGRTTCSSRILASFAAPYTATAARRLEEAGAVVLGKTNMDEFAMGSSTESSATGVTRNPHDPERVAGGSSGGSAAAVASGCVPLALGSDTGGSVRQPAAFCGVVGLKPSYGRVSRYGLVAYGSSLDQIGPIARSVRDAAAALAVIAGPDPADSTCLERAVPDYAKAIEEAPRALRLGLPRELFGEGLDAGVRRAIEGAVEVYRGLGAEVVEVSLPHSSIERDAAGTLSSYAVACYYIVAMAEASSNLARYCGVHYGSRTPGPTEDIVELYSRSRSEGFGDEVKRRILLGTYTLSSGYYDAYYRKALEVRRLIQRDFLEAFGLCDVILCPTTPTAAFRIGEKTQDPLTMYLEDVYTISVSLAGLPALSVPCGFVQAGDRRLPVGMQIVGPLFEEGRVLAAAHRFEREARGAA